ncbi:hypothetical protein BGX27_004514 [Mortierella sp. AM989]|nr:hypothetical protein BGX27_004514 [Mortierella sp. AM989]
MPSTIPTPSINITPTQGSNTSAASSYGASSFCRSSIAPSGSFHSAQLRRSSFFAPFPYSQSPQYSDFSNNNLLDAYDSSSIVGDVYERDLEANYCKNFSCCGLTLGDLHALLQHYEEAHVRFEEDEDEDDLLGVASFTDDDGWSTHSESVPSSPQMNGSRQLNSAFSSAAATVAALTAACVKNGSLSPAGAKKKSNGVSLSDIYSEDTAFSPDEVVSAFPNSILRSVAQANQIGQSCKKRDLSTFSSSFDAQSPLSKKASTIQNKIFSTNINAAAALTAATLIGDIHSSSKTNPSELNPSISLGTQDDLMNTVTGYLEQAIQRGLLPNCGEVGSPSYLLAVEELLRKREEIVTIMESIGRPGVSGADKPYRCTVSGCDKAYKNPNGLKYHNQHGHCSLGASDEDRANIKPYRCTFLDCGKCYKNLNGLKYHIEHSHPNLAAALYANIPGLANLEGGNASQAAITAAAAIAAVKGDTNMMSAINAIIASAANNGNRPVPSSPSDNTPDSSPNSSPMLGPVATIPLDGFRGSENPFSNDVTPIASPLLTRATLPNLTLSIQTTLGVSKEGSIKIGGLMTPSSLSPTLTTSPKSPMFGSPVSTLTAALAAVAVEQQRAREQQQ